MMHNKSSWIQPILLVVIFATTAAADVTARGSFDAGKDVTFNAAMKAIEAKEWKLRNASYRRGAIWFVPASEISQATFDAAVFISPAGQGCEVSILLRAAKKQPAPADANRLLDQLLKSMAGKKRLDLDQVVTKQMAIDRASGEGVIRDADMSSAFDRALAAAKSLGRVVRANKPTGELVYISNNSANETSGARLSIGIQLVDQAGDVRAVLHFWTVNGQRIADSTLENQALTEFMEQQVALAPAVN